MYKDSSQGTEGEVIAYSWINKYFIKGEELWWPPRQSLSAENIPGRENTKSTSRRQVITVKLCDSGSQLAATFITPPKFLLCKRQCELPWHISRTLDGPQICDTIDFLYQAFTLPLVKPRLLRYFIINQEEKLDKMFGLMCISGVMLGKLTSSC